MQKSEKGIKSGSDKTASGSKVTWVEVITHDPRALQTAPNYYRDDRDIVILAVSQLGSALKYAGPNSRDCEDIVLIAVKQHHDAYKYASERLQNTLSVILATVDRYPFSFISFKESIKNDPKVIKAVVSKDGFLLREVNEESRDNETIVKAAVSNYSPALEYASLRLRSNKEMVLTAVMHGGGALAYADDVFKDDDRIARLAISTRPWAYKEISPRLQNDYSLAVLAVKKQGIALQLMNSKMKNNVKIVTTAVLSDPDSFRYAGSELQKNKSFIISLIKQSCEIGFWINASMQDDADVVRHLILHTLEGFNLSCSERLKDDEFIVRLACQQNGSNLSCVSERLQSRMDLKRLTSGFCYDKPHPLDLFSSPEKNNKKLMLPFMQQSPCAYLKLDDLKKDLEVALTAYLSTRYNRPWIRKIHRSKLRSEVEAQCLEDIVSVYQDSIRQLYSLLTTVSSMSLLKVVIKQGSMTLASIFPSLPTQYTIDDFCSDFVKHFMPETGIYFKLGKCILDYLHILDVKTIFYVLGNRLPHRFGERERSQRNHSDYADVFEDAQSVLGVTFQCR